MMDLEYEDFDVEVVVPQQGKPLVLVKCQQGTGKEEVDLSPQLFTQDVSAIAATVTRSSKSRGRLDEAQLRPEEFERLGRNLFDRLLPRTLAELYSLTRGAAGERHKGTRIRLTIEDPAIARLPWELLNSSRDNFLCLAKETPVIRNPSVPRPVAPLEAQLPLRVLAVMSNSATEPLDLEEEKHRVEQAFGPLREGNQLKLVWFERGTLDALSNQLEEFDPHILHFAGHGEFNERSGEGQITLQDDRGNSVPLAAADLALLLKGVPSLRLVFLNSCEGAREGSKALSSTASQLIAAGVPAVIAMQFEISDDVAIAFAEKVYCHLCKNRPIDDAVTRARIGIKVNQSFEWSTPVLYLRAREAVLFHFDKKDTEPPPPSSLPPPTKGRFQKLVKFPASHPLILVLLGAGFLALIVWLVVSRLGPKRQERPTAPSNPAVRVATAAGDAAVPPAKARDLPDLDATKARKKTGGDDGAHPEKPAPRLPVAPNWKKWLPMKEAEVRAELRQRLTREDYLRLIDQLDEKMKVSDKFFEHPWVTERLPQRFVEDANRIAEQANQLLLPKESPDGTQAVWLLRAHVNSLKFDCSGAMQAYENAMSVTTRHDLQRLLATDLVWCLAARNTVEGTKRFLLSPQVSDEQRKYLAGAFVYMVRYSTPTLIRRQSVMLLEEIGVDWSQPRTDYLKRALLKGQDCEEASTAAQIAIHGESSPEVYSILQEFITEDPEGGNKHYLRLQHCEDISAIMRQISDYLQPAPSKAPAGRDR